MKRVLVTGGSGFIGRRFCAKLVERGDLVTVLTRDVPAAKRALPSPVRVATWSRSASDAWAEELGVVDAVVHLAGENVANRWTYDRKREIVASRVDATHALVAAIAKAKHKPSTFVCASAIGYYGPRPGDEELDEGAEPGEGFLADVVKRWEAAAREVEKLGVRSVQVRIGVVLGEGGGALEKMIAPFRFFAGGPLGDGKQVISWVHRDDAVGILLMALDDEQMHGPINAVAPEPATSKELADAIGRVMNRPAWVKTPEAAIRFAMGEVADIIVTGQRVYPRRAVAQGYEFYHAHLVPALESILAPA